MSTFIKLNKTYSGASSQVLVNISNINCMSKKSNGGTLIYFSDGNSLEVVQEFEDIMKTIDVKG